MPFSRVLNIKCVKLTQGSALLEMPVVYDTHANWNNKVCGGATSALMDIAIGAAVETLVDVEDEIIATSNINVNFLASADLGKIVQAEAKWTEATTKEGHEEIPLLHIPPAGKKLIHLDAHII